MRGDTYVIQKVSCILWWIFQQSKTILKNSFTVTLSRKSAIKGLIQTSPHLKSVTKITLQNINFQKPHRPKAHQRQTGRAHAEENVTAVSELVLSQYDQLQIHRLTH